MAVKNQSDLRDNNIRMLLQALVRSGPLSRSELCRAIGLTPPAVTGLTKQLLDDGILFEQKPGTRQPTGAGRPPILLQLRDDAYTALGVEIGVDRLTMGVIGITGKFLHVQTLRLDATALPEQIVDAIYAFYANYTANLQGPGVHLCGIGLAATGRVDSTSGINRFAPNLGWRDVPLGTMLQDRLQIPVSVDNNVRLMALAEEWFGKARNSRSLVFVQVGSGVGCGILLPGIGLVRGTYHGAGELGHCTVVPQGPLCTCGKHGCLEALVSNKALVKAYEQASGSSALPSNDRQGQVAVLVQRAQDGDPIAKDILLNAAEHLGIGLATIVNLIEPRSIILNGNAFVRTPLTRGWIQEAVQKHTFGNAMAVEFLDSTFQDKQAMVGAATAVLRRCVL